MPASESIERNLFYGTGTPTPVRTGVMDHMSITHIYAVMQISPARRDDVSARRDDRGCPIVLSVHVNTPFADLRPGP
jgi:hypothetical protein